MAYLYEITFLFYLTIVPYFFEKSSDQISKAY